MNDKYEQEIRYRLLKILSREENISQRDLSREMGISLGKVNYCLSELAKRGLIKIHRFKSAKNKQPYSYILTSRGIKEKSQLCFEFLKSKIAEYTEIKDQIRMLADELEAERFEGMNDTDLLNALYRIS